MQPCYKKVFGITRLALFSRLPIGSRVNSTTLIAHRRTRLSVGTSTLQKQQFLFNHFKQ